MSTSDIRNKYHVSIDGVGYIIQGTPDKPAYLRDIAPSIINRLAVSYYSGRYTDLTYSDFSGQGLFYQAQTDWSGGIKAEQEWDDDTKYYYSTNIDAYSNHGKISVQKELVSEISISEDIYCGAELTVNGNTNLYIGGYKNASSNQLDKIYYKTSVGSWSYVYTGFSGAQNAVSYLADNDNLLWMGTVGNGNTEVVNTYNGSSWTDHTAAIMTALSWSGLTASRAICEMAGVLYVGVEDYVNKKSALVSTSDNGSTWTALKSFNYTNEIISMASYDGLLYYLTYNYPVVTLRVYDPVGGTDIIVHSFTADVTGIANVDTWNKLLKVFQGKLIITLTNEIYSYDGNNILQIFSRDAIKKTIGKEADVDIEYGCVESGNKLFWGNLVYDGTAFFNFKKMLGDSTSYILDPLFVDHSGNIYYMRNITTDVYLYKDATTYKPTLSKNFIVLNEMSRVTSIDKLLHSFTVIYEKMISGDQIKIEFSIDNMSTWTTAATLTYASEGGSRVQREIFIPNNIIFNKIWWKVSLANSNGTSSPVILDMSMSYKPIPNYKNRWQMRLNFTDRVKLLNETNDKRDGYDMNSQIWIQKLVKKNVKFEDLDYMECTLKNAITSTQTSAMIDTDLKIPPQGRMRMVSGGIAEEIYYTSGTTDRILGMVRGARGTTARSYPSGQVLDNGYDVYVDSIASRAEFTDNKKTEFGATVILIES